MTLILGEPFTLLVLSAISGLIYAAAAFIAATTSGRSTAGQLGLAPTTFRKLLLSVLFFLFVNQTLAVIVRLTGAASHSLSLPLLARGITSAEQKSPLLNLLFIGLLPGFSEELFFRGFLQQRFVARWGSRVGVLIAALLFGLAHFDPVHSPLALAMGLSLGWVFVVTGSLWCCIAAHAINNSLVALGVDLPGGRVPNDWVLLVAFPVLALLAGIALRRGRQGSTNDSPVTPSG